MIRDPNLPAGDRRLDRWFDTAAFARPPNFRFGNQGVNIPRADGLTNLDFSLLWNFSFSEERKLQFRAESFNTTNTAWFGIPG